MKKFNVRSQSSGASSSWGVWWILGPRTQVRVSDTTQKPDTQ